MKNGSQGTTGCELQALLDSLYEDHELTEDMAIGPVVLQRPPSLRLVFQSPLKLIGAHRTKETETNEVKCTTCQAEGIHYTCAYCGEQIYSRLTMIAHLRSHTTLTCTLCSKTFKSCSALQQHMITHSGERKFSCNACNRTYKTTTALDAHQLTHQPKRFQCKSCSKRFTQKIHLQVHARSHTGEKPYECKFCFKGFTQLTSLNNHMLIHTDVKPYSCSFCEKKFRQVSNVKQHVLKNHPEESTDFSKKHTGKKFSLAWYSCKNCQAVLPKHSDVSKHLKLCQKQN